ncbi:MAG: head-tail adaptor protein [Peptococcaceae bacterium]|nr:head-tail adaptor protein [Peptococcaceae bacterium]
MSLQSLFNNVFTHQRPTITRDEYGGCIITWNTLGTIKGRLRPTGVSERSASYLANPQAVVSHVFYCGPGVDIRSGDRVVLGNVTVEILGVKNPSYANHHIEAEGKVIQ